MSSYRSINAADDGEESEALLGGVLPVVHKSPDKLARGVTKLQAASLTLSLLGLAAVLVATVIRGLSSDAAQETPLPHGFLAVYVFVAVANGAGVASAITWLSCRSCSEGQHGGLRKSATVTSALLRAGLVFRVVAWVFCVVAVAAWTHDSNGSNNHISGGPDDGSSLSSLERLCVTVAYWVTVSAPLVAMLVDIAALGTLRSMEALWTNSESVITLKLKLYGRSASALLCSVVAFALWVPRFPESNIDDWNSALETVLVLAGALSLMLSCSLNVRHLGPNEYLDETGLWRMLGVTQNLARLALVMLVLAGAFSGLCVYFVLQRCHSTGDHTDADCYGHLHAAPAVVPFGLLAFGSLVAAYFTVAVVSACSAVNNYIISESASNFGEQYVYGENGVVSSNQISRTRSRSA